MDEYVAKVRLLYCRQLHSSTCEVRRFTGLLLAFILLLYPPCVKSQLVGHKGMYLPSPRG